MGILRKFLILAILLIALPCWAAVDEHFVTLNGAGSFSGADWANAFSLAGFNNAANWDTDVADDNKIGPGDTVYFDGDVGGVTYTQLKPAGSGSAGNLIYIRPGSYHASFSAGHDGLVTITDSASAGIYINSKSYIEVNGKKSSASTDRNIISTLNEADGVVVLSASYQIYLKYLTLLDNGAAGVLAYQMTDSTPSHFPLVDVSYCDIGHNDEYWIYTQGIGSHKYFDKFVYHHNIFHDRTGDGFKTSGSLGLTIHDNYIYDLAYSYSGFDEGALGEHGDETFELYDGYTKIYNNVIKNSSYKQVTVDSMEATTGWNTGSETNTVISTEANGVGEGEGTNNVKVVFGSVGVPMTGIHEVVIRKDLGAGNEVNLRPSYAFGTYIKASAGWPTATWRLEVGESGYTGEWPVNAADKISAPGTTFKIASCSVGASPAMAPGKDKIRYLQLRITFSPVTYPDGVTLDGDSVNLDWMHFIRISNSFAIVDMGGGSDGKVFIFNNLVYSDTDCIPGDLGSAMSGPYVSLTEYAGNPYNGTTREGYYLLNNTFVNIGGYGYMLQREDSSHTVIASDFHIYNNVFKNVAHCMTGNSPLLYLGYANDTTLTSGSYGDTGKHAYLDNNAYWSSRSVGDTIYVKTSGITYDLSTAGALGIDGYKSDTGADESSQFIDPTLSAGYKPASISSPIYGAGANLTSLCSLQVVQDDSTYHQPLAALCTDSTIDYDGTVRVGLSRPVSNPWDIGAYQYAAGGTTYLLTVTKAGTGDGTVTSSPVGINCGVVCAASFDDSTVVTLTGTPVGANTLAWSGEGCSGSGTCVVTMSAARNVTATFTLDAPPAQYGLDVSYTGTGLGTTIPAAGITVYDSGAAVTATQSANSGSTLAGWGGDCGCTGSGACGFNMPAADCSVIATFTENTKYTLTVSAPSSVSLVTSDVGYISCGLVNYDCIDSYYSGTVVLTGICSAGYNNLTWTGDGTGTTTRSFTMSSDQVVGASCDKIVDMKLGTGVENIKWGTGTENFKVY